MTKTKVFCLFCVATLCGLSRLSYGQGCSDAPTLKNAYIGNLGTKGSDGLIHITYAFTDAQGNAIANPTMQSAFDSAFSGWNIYSSITGVKFDAAPQGSSPDLSITGDAKAGNCIGGDPGSLNISYGPDWLARFSAPQNAPQNVVAVEHEVGHLLGMADTIPSVGTDLMNKASSCANGSNSTGLKSNDPTSSSDARVAGSCVILMITSHASSSGGGGGGGSGSQYGMCYTSYTEYNTTVWNGSKFVVTVVDTVNDTECI